MASTYNSRPLVPEVLVKGGDFAVIRARETIVDMLSRERLPLGRRTRFSRASPAKPGTSRPQGTKDPMSENGWGRPG